MLFMTSAHFSLPSKYILFVSVYLAFKNQPFVVNTPHTREHIKPAAQKGVLRLLTLTGGLL